MSLRRDQDECKFFSTLPSVDRSIRCDFFIGDVFFFLIPLGDELVLFLFDWLGSLLCVVVRFVDPFKWRSVDETLKLPYDSS